MPKSALITGITGQDGSYLAEFLLEKGYNVSGMIRRASTFNTDRINHIFDDLNLYHGDVADTALMHRIIKETKPDEIYHLAAQSHVKVSFENAVYTFDTVAGGTVRLLETIRNMAPNAKFYFAGSSEMFGKTPPPQHEGTPFWPRSPYGVAKLAGHQMTVNYRESYGVFACTGILFNHESPRRGKTFVTRKITTAAARIKMGLQDKLILGNLDARRDWGHAKDYVRAMWMILQHDEPDDFVIGTGTQASVREFVELVFDHLGLDWREYVTTDPKYLRPAEVDSLLADASKARDVLGWKPEYDLRDLAREMVEVDLKLAEQEKALVEISSNHGWRSL
jgi:GDPmannose 4,6-dehydratase